MKLAYANKLDIDPLEILPLILAGKKPPRGMMPRGPWKDTFEEAFYLIQDDLGLNDNLSSVEIVILEYIPGNEMADGQTRNDLKDPYHIMLKAMSPHHTIGVLAHEMIHVRDIATGVLALSNKGKTLSYQGKKVNRDLAIKSIELNQESVALPHERTAYNLAPSLTLRVFEKLSPANRKWLEKEYQETLKPPTLLDYYKRDVQRRIEKNKKAEEAFQKAKEEGSLSDYFKQFQHMSEVY
jgi:hypothetical protein